MTDYRVSHGWDKPHEGTPPKRSLSRSVKVRQQSLHCHFLEAPTVRRMIAYGKRTPEGRSAAIGKRQEKEEALKGLRKGRGRRLERVQYVSTAFSYDAPTERLVLFDIALPMASLGEAPRLAIGYHTTHRWCVRAEANKAFLALHGPGEHDVSRLLHQRVNAGMKAPQNTIAYSPATAAHYTCRSLPDHRPADDTQRL